MYRVKLTKDTIHDHFLYNKWWYFLGAVITLIVWFIIVRAATPGIPADKKLDIFFVGGSMNISESYKLGEAIKEDVPDLLEVNFDNIQLEKDENMNYINTQKLITKVMSETGDIFIFIEEDFQNWAQDGFFLALDDEVEDIKRYFTEEELSKVRLASETDNTERLYGIPLDRISTLDSVYDVEGSIMGIPHYSKNKDKAIAVLRWIIINGME